MIQANAARGIVRGVSQKSVAARIPEVDAGVNLIAGVVPEVVA